MADHIASSPGMSGGLPKEDPFMGDQQSLFSGGPMDPATPAPDISAKELEPDAHEAPAEKTEAELLRERVEAQERMIERMLSGQAAQAAPPAQVASPITPPGPAPDAVTKPAEFAQWLDKKLSYERQLTEAATNERERRTEAATNLDRLWQQFQREYSDAADDEDLVAAAFQKVVQRNGGRVPSDSKMLLKDVANQVHGWRGAKPANDPPAGRTQGVSPGKGARKADPKAATSKEPPPKRFVDQLSDLQLKTGFF